MVPYQVSEMAGLYCPEKLGQCLVAPQNATVCWEADCGHLRIAKKSRQALHTSCKACRLSAVQKQEGLMMQATDAVVNERRMAGYGWLMFVEVPIPCDKQVTVLVDVVLVLDMVPVTVPRKRCVIAIEHDGVSHLQPFPVNGCKIQGLEKQRCDDERKETVLKHLDTPLLRFSCTECSLSISCKQEWRERLLNAMSVCEQGCMV